MKSRTQRAVDLVLSQLARYRAERRKWDALGVKPITAYRAAKRHGLALSGVSRALKLRLRQKRCQLCKQLIRRKPR